MWRHNAKCENMLNLKTLSDTLWRWVKKMLSASCSHYTDSKKKRNFFHLFLDIRMSKMSVSLRRNAHFQITPNENLKNQMFFSRPWWLKLVFRWGETSISTLESCACHRKMIMTLKCPSTKSHKYHVSSFWRENLKIKIGNPSQGAVSTAYLVVNWCFFGYLWWKALSDVSGTIVETANQNSSTAECWPAPGFGIVFAKVLARANRQPF